MQHSGRAYATLSRGRRFEPSGGSSLSMRSSFYTGPSWMLSCVARGEPSLMLFGGFGRKGRNSDFVSI